MFKVRIFDGYCDPWHYGENGRAGSFVVHAQHRRSAKTAVRLAKEALVAAYRKDKTDLASATPVLYEMTIHKDGSLIYQENH